jgi:Ca2+-binding EF-hand superfamily protein
MAKSKKSALENRFRKAVREYGSLISDNYFCRMGDEDPEGPAKEEISKLFEEGKGVVQKRRFLYLVLEGLCRPSGDERLYLSCCQKAFQLHDKLEKSM